MEEDGEAQKEEDSTLDSASTLPADTKNAKSKKEETPQDAAERRRIWAMAAASAAEMLKELTQRQPPKFEDVTGVFAPITPGEWAEKRAAINQLREQIDLLDADEITDAQVADELFYDPEANNDDLGIFLGPSDQDLKAIYRGTSADYVQLTKKAPVGILGKLGGGGGGGGGAVTAPAPAKQSVPAVPAMPTTTMASEDEGEGGSKPTIVVEASSDDVMNRKSSFREGERDPEALLPAGPSSSSAIADHVSDKETPVDQSQAESSQNIRQSTFATGEGDPDQKRQTKVTTDDDDFFYAYQEEPAETSAEAAQGDEANEDSEIETYYPADININVDEALVGLESLLDDMKMESRITDRFKYKLINKYSLLLQALITYQERETETITHLQTKRKILSALHEFVKTEAEAASKAVQAEEQKEEEKDDGQGGLDFGMGGKEDGTDSGEKKKDQGLSIEEMPAATIRETLLQQKNRLEVLDAIKKIHVLQLKQLEFERTLLNLHYSRMVKPSDLSKEIKDSRRQVNDLQLEISSIHQEMGQVQNEIRIQEKQILEEEKQVEKLELEALTKQGEIQVLANKPVHLAKEADREAQKLEQLQDTHDNLCTRYMDSMEIYRANQTKIDVLHAELTSLTKMELKLIQQKKTAIKDHEMIGSQMEALMQREHLMLDRATVLTEKMQQLIKQKKKIQEEQHRMYNDANKSLREAQKLERSIKLAADAYINAKLAYDKMRTAFDAVKPSAQSSNWEKLSRMLQKEIHNLKEALNKKLDEANYKSGMVAKLQAKLNQLYEQQVASGKELQDLIRTTVRKRREREEKAEQCIKLEGQIQRITLEKKSREIAINDCLRAEKIIFKQLHRVQQKFNNLKLEKSAIINELAAARNKLHETKLKIEDLGNKLNAYIAQTQVFEAMTKEKYYIILNARIKRDSIKSDAMRSRQRFRFYRNQKFELLLNNKTLRREAERQKFESIQIRKDFEKSTSRADEYAIGYRVRVEEICTFHEYIYCYEKILLRGAEEITIREMEKSKLHSLYEETRKHVFIVQMNQPDETEYFRRIEKLRASYYEITNRRRDLEQKLNDDDNPARVREIGFEKIKEKENLEILGEKLDLREEYLAVRDVIGLERTLMENHLTKIAEDSLEQALYLKDYYGEQVKGIVNIRRNLNNVSQQMEGFICENAIASAQADIAEKHYSNCKLVIHEAEARWAQGLPPTEEMEQEWNRLQWRKAMLTKSRGLSNRKGFFREVNPKNGSQIQAMKWTPKKRQLENVKASPLGWRFTAPLIGPPRTPSLKFKCVPRQKTYTSTNVK